MTKATVWLSVSTEYQTTGWSMRRSGASSALLLNVYLMRILVLYDLMVLDRPQLYSRF